MFQQCWLILIGNIGIKKFNYYIFKFVRLNYLILFRHAALMAISAVGEGCHKQMQPMLQDILDGILNFLQDPVCYFILLRCTIFNYNITHYLFL